MHLDIPRNKLCQGSVEKENIIYQSNSIGSMLVQKQEWWYMFITRSKVWYTQKRPDVIRCPIGSEQSGPTGAQKLMSLFDPRGVCLLSSQLLRICPQSHKVHYSVNSQESKVRAQGRYSWQFCLKIILSNLICEVYIKHEQNCQAKLFIAYIVTCVLPPVYNLQF